MDMSDIEQGNVLLYSGRVQEAADAFRRALLADPQQAQAHCGLGNALLALGDEDGAWSALETACRLSDNIAAAHSARAWLAFRRGEFELAQRSASRALALDPADANGMFVAAQLLLNAGHFDHAEAMFERAAAVHSRYVDARDQLAGQAYDRGDFPLAARHYGAYARHHRTNVKAWTNLGMSLARTRQLAEARLALEHAVRLAPEQLKPTALLTSVLKALGAPDHEQVPVLERLVALAPDSAEARQELDRVRTQAGR